MTIERFKISRRSLLANGGAMAALLPFAGPLLAQERGGYLSVICHPEPATLMLPLSTQGPTQLIGGKIFEGLLNFEHDLTPVPNLARSWDVAEDGLTYTFHLADNVTWHDGEPFTAHDVIFTTRDFLPETHSRARNNFANVDSWEAPDDHTVVFRMKHPFGPFLGAFQVGSAPMVPRHIYEGTDFRNNPANAHPVGTGPFKFVEWQRGSHIRLTRNEDYWKPDLPRVDDMYFQIIPDVGSRTLAVENGNVDVASTDDIEFFDVARLTEMPHLNRVDVGDEIFGQVGWLEINHRVEPLNDKRFRQALMYALDRNFIHERIWFGVGQVAEGPIASTTAFHNPDAPKYDYNPARAAELLDEMGLEPDAQGRRVSLKLLQSPYGGPWARLAEYTRQALGEIGINIVIESTDAGAFAQRVSNWDFELTFNILLQFGDPALGVARSYISSNINQGIMFSNTMGYVNPRVDELFATGAATIDQEARRAAYHEVQDILLDDVPVVWLLELKRPTFVNARAHDVITGANGRYDDFARAWVDN